MLAVLVLAALGADSLELSVGPQVGCRLGERLPPALEAQGLTVAQQNHLHVAASGSGDSVTVQLSDAGDLIGQRVLRFGPGDCDVLPKTVALLVKAWLSQRFASPEPPPLERVDKTVPKRVTPPVEATRATTQAEAVEPPPVRAEPGPVARTPSRAAVKPEPEVAATPPVPVAPSVAPSPPASEATPAEAPPATLPPPPAELRATSTSPAVAVPSESSAHDFVVELLGGASLAPADALTAQGQLCGELGLLEPLGLAIDGGAQTLRTRHAGPGSVTVDLEWLSLMARLRASLSGRLVVWAALGGRVERMGASSHGYLVDASTALVTFAGVAAVELRATLVRQWFVSARLEGSLRMRPESFSVDAVGTVLTVPAWGAALLLGVGWTF